MTPSRLPRPRLTAGLLDGVLVSALAAASEDPPGVPGATRVMNVGTDWDGTVHVVDPTTFRVLER